MGSSGSGRVESVALIKRHYINLLNFWCVFFSLFEYNTPALRYSWLHVVPLPDLPLYGYIWLRLLTTIFFPLAKNLTPNRILNHPVLACVFADFHWGGSRPYYPLWDGVASLNCQT